MDAAFSSRERALQAAEGYGRREEVREVVALHLEGVLSVIFHDVGDIMVDGRTAKRLVKACRRRGIPVNRRVGCRIDERERETRYSCRELLGG